MKPKTIGGLVLLAIFSVLLIQSFGASVGGYMDFAEAEQTSASAHVVGTWDREAGFTYDPHTNIFSFVMLDEGGARRPVVYHNPKPPNFEDADQVVVEGHMGEGAFVAEHILVKCPSKYNDERAIQAMEAQAS
jgi:cytochrome c-type biogenesis protein CcmE